MSKPNANGIALSLGVTTVALICFSPMWGGSPWTFYNTGASMAAGRYVWQPFAEPVVGSVVVVRRPPHFRLPWLMKRVQGVVGDRYCWHPELNRHLLNKRLMPEIPALARQIGIPIWRGCRRLEADEVVGYGDGVDSYDSRYFGPLHRRDLWGVYRQL